MTRILIISLLFICADVRAQSKAGLTGIRDTSFSTYNAYQSAKKKYPNITIAQQTHSRAVAEYYNIEYCNIGERKLLLDVFSPKKKGHKKRTAVVIIFGGGWRSGSRDQHYPLAEALAERGYVCFTPDYRLSTEALYPAAVYDVKSSIKWVRANAKKYHVDPDRITILGFSAGGQLAALTGSTNYNGSFEQKDNNLNTRTNVNAVIDIDGTLSFVHPESGEGDDSKKVSAATYWFGYTKKENPDLWKQASPLNSVGKSTPPFLFINSSVERMHAGRNDFIKIMDSLHIYNEVHEFENSPHSFCLFEPWFTPTVNFIDAFLQKIFKP